MNPFHTYIADKLEAKLRERRVVVWYDPERAFEPFIAELPREGEGEIPRVRVGETAAGLAVYDGSYFALRLLVEPWVAGSEPQRLLVYVPGEKRPPKKESALLELEEGGATYEPALDKLARHPLRRRYTDGDIDEMTRPASLTYGDVVRFLEQDGDGGGSMLRTLFERQADSERRLAAWLAEPERDGPIAEKEASAELYRLIATRLGLTLAPETDLAAARERTARYLLVNEFRADLNGAPPASLNLIPEPATAEQRRRVRTVADALRKDHAEAYVGLAERTEAALRLGQAELDPAALGGLDTFPFEERALLTHCDALIAQGCHDAAADIARARRRSFWVDRDPQRMAQWHACGLMAELGQAIERVRPALRPAGADAAAWIEGYAAEGGWHRADQLHRRLEALVAGMDEEAEAARALTAVRTAHEKLLADMAQGFTKALTTTSWPLPGTLAQTAVFAKVVEASREPVAYFLIDSMRYEMGVELSEQLADAEDLRLRPAVAALPTITPVGMAALLPGAQDSFTVVEHKGKLAARIGDTAMAGWQERRSYLLAERPGTVEMTLDALLQSRPETLRQEVAGKALVVVRSQEIDAFAESGHELAARRVMAMLLNDIAKGVRTLAKAGLERFVLTADHGHQFAARKGSHMRTDPPGGETVKVERRCWAGRGGATPPGAVRMRGEELGYATDLEFIFPAGIGVFETYGDLSYHHGGLSLQELLVPVLSLRVARPADEAGPDAAIRLFDVPDAITNRIFSVKLAFEANLLSGEAQTVRVVLMGADGQLGLGQMAVNAECDARTGELVLPAGEPVVVGIMLLKDDAQRARVVVQDPATDALLAESEEIPIKLGI